MEIALPHRIFGVGQTFSKVREALRITRDMTTPAAVSHFRLGEGRMCVRVYGLPSGGTG
jgi:hypothetical protein